MRYQLSAVNVAARTKEKFEQALKATNLSANDLNRVVANSGLTASSTIPKAGKEIAQLMAREYTSYLSAGLPTGAKITAEMRTLQVDSQARFGELADRAAATASSTMKSLGADILNSTGLPPAAIQLAAPFIKTAQEAVLGGAGKVLGDLLGQAGALAGPFGMLAGPLLSVGMGMLFGKEKVPPPPKEAAKRNTTLALAPPEILPGWVLGELILASYRWHKMQTSVQSSGIYAYDFAFRPNDLKTLVTGGLNQAVNILPSGHTKHWRLFPSGRTEPGLLDTPNTGSDIGAPIARTTDADKQEYVFTFDALGEFTSYNRAIADALGLQLKKAFDPWKDTPHLEPFSPFFGEIGWAEFIVASALAEYGTRGDGLEALAHLGIGQLTVFKNKGGLQQKLAPYLTDQLDAIAARSNGTEVLLSTGTGPAASPVRHGAAALALVTGNIRLALGAQDPLAKRGEQAHDKAKSEINDLKGWMETKFKSIESKLGEIGLNVEKNIGTSEETRKIAQDIATAQAKTDKIIRYGAIGIGAVTLLGGALLLKSARKK